MAQHKNTSSNDRISVTNENDIITIFFYNNICAPGSFRTINIRKGERVIITRMRYLKGSIIEMKLYV